MRGASIAIVALAIGVAASAALAGREEEKARAKAWEEARAAFGAAFQNEDPKARRAAVLKLVPFADAGAAELVADKVFGVERNYSVLGAAVEVIAAAREPKLVEWLAKKAVGKDPWPLRAPVVEALGGIPSEEARGALRKILEKEKDPRVLSMALFAAGTQGMKQDLGLVLPHLEHEDWQVRVAAIEILAAFKEDRSLEPLVDRLFHERGRLREDLAAALRAITGKNFGKDAARWHEWLMNKRSGKPDPSDAPAAKAPDRGYEDGPTYFGLEVTSERVVFVIDVSMSMKTAIDVDKMKLAREAALTGAAAAENRDDERFEETIEWWKIKDRLDLAKAQLMFVIKNLKPEQQFEVVSFSKSVTPWNGGRLVKASAAAKAKAVQFVESLDVEEDTAAGAALEFAFDMAGPGAADKNYRAGVDTIFFLSDGAPSDRNSDDILAEVSAKNVLRKIKIHVVAILNFDVEFLRQLARRNGGTYKLFKVEDKK